MNNAEINKMSIGNWTREKDRKCFIIDALKTFYLQLYGVGCMLKDNSDSKKGNQLSPLHGLLFAISSNESFICPIPHTG